MRSIVTLIMILSLVAPVSFASASGVGEGSLVKCADHAAVYYIGYDNDRYAFPNEKVYFSWYSDFTRVQDISCSELAGYQLSGTLTYQSGTRLVKIPSVNTVYFVAPGAVLRPIRDEEQARALFGDDWATRVDDLSEAFFPRYTVGEELQDDIYPEGYVFVDEEGVLYRVGWLFTSVSLPETGTDQEAVLRRHARVQEKPSLAITPELHGGNVLEVFDRQYRPVPKVFLQGRVPDLQTFMATVRLVATGGKLVANLGLTDIALEASVEELQDQTTFTLTTNDVRAYVERARDYFEKVDEVAGIVGGEVDAYQDPANFSEVDEIVTAFMANLEEEVTVPDDVESRGDWDRMQAELDRKYAGVQDALERFRSLLDS